MRMRAVAVSAVLLVSGLGPSAYGAQPDASASGMQLAYTSWLVKKGGEAVLYFAAGVNHVPSEWPSVGFVGRAECKQVSHGHHSELVCRARQEPIQLRPGDFIVDPSLSGARLTVTKGGFTHEVSWTGTGDPPEPFWHQHAGNDVDEVLVMAWMNRRAEATGTVFDQEMAAGRGMIGESSHAVVSTNYRSVGVDFGPAELRDGLLVVHERYGAHK